MFRLRLVQHILIACFYCLFSSFLEIQAQDAKAYVNKKSLHLGEVLILYLEIEDAALLAHPSFPEIQGCEKGSLTAVADDQSRGNHYTYTQKYFPQNVGRYRIPEFLVEMPERSFKTEAFSIEVFANAPNPASGGKAVQADPIDAFLEFRLSKEAVYVGEPFGVQVDAWVSEKDRAKFQLLKDDARGLYDWWNEDWFYMESLPLEGSGEKVDQYIRFPVFNGFLIPKQGGEYLFSGIFLRISRMPASAAEFVSEDWPLSDQRITIKNLPLENGDNLAVGKLSLKTDYTRGNFRTGRPIQIEVRVEGYGDPARFPKPIVSLHPQFVSFEPLSEYEIERRNGQLFGVKRFHYILLGTQAGAFNMFSLSLPYFDPETGQVDSLRQARFAARLEGSSFSQLLEASALEQFYPRSFQQAEVALSPISHEFWYEIGLTGLLIITFLSLLLGIGFLLKPSKH